MWTKDYVACVKCGCIDHKHQAKGLCKVCYLELYRNDPKNTARIKAAKRKYQIEVTRSGLGKIRREIDHFDGKREAILRRDNYTCQSCGEIRLSRLSVHHIDGNGRRSKTPNNDENNLITMCRSCHAILHNTVGRWATDYDACIKCGNSSRRHSAYGLCCNCYTAIRKKAIRKRRRDSLVLLETARRQPESGCL
jgi:hypothetical protein